MHISTLYASTYSPKEPIKGHADIQTDHGMIRVNFNPDECAQIQEITVAAYLRQRQALADELLSNDPSLIALANYSDAEEEAEFTSAESDPLDQVPF